MSLVQQVELMTNDYVRKGGKDNRRQQRSTMMAFAAHAEASGARRMAQVGHSHVIRYWKAHRGLSEATKYSHWRALCILWKLAKKPGGPPRAWSKNSEMGNGGLAPVETEF